MAKCSRQVHTAHSCATSQIGVELHVTLCNGGCRCDTARGRTGDGQAHPVPLLRTGATVAVKGQYTVVMALPNTAGLTGSCHRSYVPGGRFCAQKTGSLPDVTLLYATQEVHTASQ